jgi:hypothetical protein
VGRIKSVDSKRIHLHNGEKEFLFLAVGSITLKIEHFTFSATSMYSASDASDTT